MLTEVLHSACKDCVTRLLDKSDTLRLGSKTGASEVKQHKWFAKINWGLLRNTEPPVGVCNLHLHVHLFVFLFASSVGCVSIC